MALDHASVQQTLQSTSRELGGVLPPTQPDGTPVAVPGSVLAKSSAHFIAGG